MKKCSICFYAKDQTQSFVWKEELNTNRELDVGIYGATVKKVFFPHTMCPGQFAQIWYVFCLNQPSVQTQLGAPGRCEFVTQKTPFPDHLHHTVLPIPYFSPIPLSESFVLPQSTLLSPLQNSYGICLHQSTDN